jgi:hypothetical protein
MVKEILKQNEKKLHTKAFFKDEFRPVIKDVPSLQLTKEEVQSYHFDTSHHFVSGNHIYICNCTSITVIKLKTMKVEAIMLVNYLASALVEIGELVYISGNGSIRIY